MMPQKYTTSASFPMTHMEDPWILPTQITSSEPVETNMPLPVAMIAYQDNLKCVADMIFPSNEVIIEAMSGFEPPWEELHHISYFLPELDRLEHEDYS